MIHFSPVQDEEQANMSEREKDILDLYTLWELVKDDIDELANPNLAPERREEIRAHAHEAVMDGLKIFQRLNPN